MFKDMLRCVSPLCKPCLGSKGVALFVLIVAFVQPTACYGEAGATTSFLRSAYDMPYDWEVDLTDVTLINCVMTNQKEIKQFAQDVISRVERAGSADECNGVLSDLFAKPPSCDKIQLIRERALRDMYRLDFSTNLNVFTNYQWDDGGFTNGHPFFVSQISRPPEGSSDKWSLHTVQAAYDHVAIETGDRQLLRNEGFYLSLFGIPPLMRVNIFLQTATTEKPSAKNLSYSQDPAGFRFFKADDKRLTQAADGGRLGKWVSQTYGEPSEALRRISFVGPDGVDRRAMSVISSVANPQNRYLAYVRNPQSGAVLGLYAWTHSKEGSVSHFLKVEQTGEETLFAMVQNIIHCKKTKTYQTSVFDVEADKYTSVYDKRLAEPVQKVNGQVVFKAEKGNRATHSRSPISSRNLVLLLMAVTTVAFSFYLFRRRKQ